MVIRRCGSLTHTTTPAPTWSCRLTETWWSTRPVVRLCGSPAHTTSPVTTWSCRLTATRSSIPRVGERPSSSRGEFHPPALTEPCLTVSRYTALLIDLSERGYPGPVSKQAGLSFDESGPPPVSLLETTQPPILVACPPHYVGVNALQETIQSRPVEPAIVVHPAAHDRIDPLGKIRQFRPDSLVYPPVTNLLTFRLEGIRADCRRERGEQLPIPVLRAARTELVCQERERRVLVRTPPVCVLAIHYLGFAGMQPQSQALQPLSEGIANLTRLILRRAMEHRVICVTLEFHGRELSLQP